MARISGGEKMREVWVWPDISGREKARESWVEVWVWPDLSGGEKIREVWVGSGRVVSCRVVSCRVVFLTGRVYYDSETFATIMSLSVKLPQGCIR